VYAVLVIAFEDQPEENSRLVPGEEKLIYRVSIVICAFAWSSLPALGQPSRLRFDHLTPADGLSQSIVYDILEDHEGFLWFATRDGVNRYDGHRFKVYRHVPGDLGTLSDSKARVLLEDRDGAIWVGTVEGGMNRLDRDTETFMRYPFPAHPRDQQGFGRITALAQDSTGLIWIGTYSGGLFSLDPDTGVMTAFRADPQSVGDQLGSKITALLVDHVGRLWVASQGGRASKLGLCLFDGREGRCVARLLDGKTVISVAETEPGHLWVVIAEASDELAIHFASENGEILERHRLPPQGTHDMTLGPDQGLWFGSQLGLSRLDLHDGTLEVVPRDPADPSGLSHDEVLSVHFDRSGAMWIGTPVGLDIYRDSQSPFRLYRGYLGNPDGLADSRVNALLETRDGMLWLGTEHGLDQIDRESGRVAHITQSPKPRVNPNAINRIWTLLEDKHGVLWVGTGRSGLHQYDRSTGTFSYERGLFREITQRGRGPGGIDFTGIRSLFEDRNGSIWIGTQVGVGRRDPVTGTYTLYGADPSDGMALSDDAVNTIFEDTDGRIWIGTDYGLNRYDRSTDRFTRFVHDPSDIATISANVIWTMAESSLTPGVLWVGTIGGGLNRFDPATGLFRTITTADGLPNNTIYGILPDDNGNLWLTTGCGLVRFSPSSETIGTYHPNRDRQCGEFDLMSYHKSARTGEMFVGEGNGFDSFFPDSVRSSEYVPPVVLTGVKIFDTERPGLLASGDTLTLNPSQNYFTVSFAALDFRGGGQNRYEYHLDGYDDQWRTQTGSNPETSYTNVPPGRYTFRVVGSNQDGIFNPEPAVLHIVIVPSLWQTQWFLVLAGMVVLAIFGTRLWIWRTRRQSRIAQQEADDEEVRRRLAEREEAERVRIARDLHDGPIQGLYHVNHLLETLTNRPELGSIVGELDAPREAVNQLARDLRNVCNGLRPPTLIHFGLEASVEECITRARRLQPTLRISLEFEGDGSLLAERTQHVVFRGVQEALNNVIQHAGAAHAGISIRIDAEGVSVSVEDDGKGFELPGRLVQLTREEHWGLVGMMERAGLVGGRCTIASIPGSGTKVHITIPNATYESESSRPVMGRWVHRGGGGS
jgi:ligand-binding sensor domain-containing protein/signal transduction histidine kinase